VERAAAIQTLQFGEATSELISLPLYFAGRTLELLQ
jgi:hypothetical protein